MKTARAIRNFFAALVVSNARTYAVVTLLALSALIYGRMTQTCESAVQPLDGRCERVSVDAPRLKITLMVGDIELTAGVARQCHVHSLA